MRTGIIKYIGKIFKATDSAFFLVLYKNYDRIACPATPAHYQLKGGPRLRHEAAMGHAGVRDQRPCGSGDGSSASV